MELIILSQLLFSFLIVLYVTPKVITIAKRYQIYDEPSPRKIHTEPITFLGGITIFLGFYLAHGVLFPTNILKPAYNQVIWFTLVSNFLLGLGDDFFDYKPIGKFFVQFLICSILIFNSGLILPFEKIIPGIEGVPYLKLILSLIVFSAITNSFNLIDGLDGLATSLSILTTGFLIGLFIIEGNTYMIMVGVTLIGSLIGFLIYNFPRAKIFMGDSGSYFNGAFIATLIFIFICNGNTEIISINKRFQIGFAIIAIPALDMIRLFLWRIIRRRSPFVGDNCHIHHLLLLNGFSIGQAVLTIILLQLIFIGIGIYFLNETSFWYYTIAGCLIYILALTSLKFRADKKQKSQQAEP